MHGYTVLKLKLSMERIRIRTSYNTVSEMHSVKYCIIYAQQLMHTISLFLKYIIFLKPLSYIYYIFEIVKKKKKNL